MKPLPDIPAAVREEAERIAARDPKAGSIAHRLVTDPRMVGVWKHLRGLKTRPDIWEPPPADTAEAAMVLVLQSCCHGGLIIDTVAELREARDGFKEQARRLCGEAHTLRERKNTVGRTVDQKDEHVTALFKAAKWCEEEAAILHKRAERAGRWVLRRGSKWNDEKNTIGIAELVAGRMDLLYGESLYSVTATIVNVVTGHQPNKKGGGEVLATHVRDWLKALRDKD
jgi:hypothetical protein